MNSGKFLIILFLKNPSDGCFRINTRSFYCPYHDLLFFQKRCHTYFSAEYFPGLIYRLGTKVSSIFQTVSQTPIFKPVKHLRLSFFSKIVNSFKPLSIFAKKSFLVDLRQGSKTLKDVVKWKTKTMESCLSLSHLQIFYTNHTFLRSVTYWINVCLKMCSWSCFFAVNLGK